MRPGRESWTILLAAVLTIAGCHSAPRQEEHRHSIHAEANSTGRHTSQSEEHRHPCRRPRKAGKPEDAAVYVGGLVKQAGSQAIPRAGLTLEEALEAAGAAQLPASIQSEYALLVTLARQHENHHFSLPFVKNNPAISTLRLEPGDVIVVQEWFKTDLVRGAVLVNKQTAAALPPVSAPPPDSDTVELFSWLLMNARDPRSAAEREKFLKKVAADLVQNALLQAAGLIRQAALEAGISNASSIPTKLDKALLREYAQQLVRGVVTVRNAPPPPPEQEWQPDWDALRNAFKERRLATGKPIMVPYSMSAGPANQQLRKLTPARFPESVTNAADASYPDLRFVAKSFLFDEDSAVVLRRDGHEFVLAIEAPRDPKKTRSAEDPAGLVLSHVQVLPDDEVEITSPSTLPIVIHQMIQRAGKSLRK